MRLRNKKTGEIVDLSEGFIQDIYNGEMIQIKPVAISNKEGYVYSSLTKLNEEWEDMPEEKWQDVLGFEELYQVSSFGNVRTIKKGEAEMSQQENRNGYMTVHLRNKGVERRAMVHRLVAEAFIPNPNGFRDVNHKNGDKSDNRVENLEWTSHADNMTHSFRELGKNVRHIVQLDLDNNFIERWNSIIEASEATGICRTNIGECCRGNRKHTKGYKWKYEEDYEEPKDFWFIDQFMSVSKGVVDDVEYAGRHKAVNYAKKTSNNLKTAGNYFETKEEAELAVRKLKAWKRLKDKGFRFFRDGNGRAIFEYSPNDKSLRCIRTAQESKEARADLDLLFGGEE